MLGYQEYKLDWGGDVDRRSFLRTSSCSIAALAFGQNFSFNAEASEIEIFYNHMQMNSTVQGQQLTTKSPTLSKGVGIRFVKIQNESLPTLPGVHTHEKSEISGLDITRAQTPQNHSSDDSTFGPIGPVFVGVGGIVGGARIGASFGAISPLGPVFGTVAGGIAGGTAFFLLGYHLGNAVERNRSPRSSTDSTNPASSAPNQDSSTPVNKPSRRTEPSNNREWRETKTERHVERAARGGEYGARSQYEADRFGKYSA